MVDVGEHGAARVGLAPQMFAGAIFATAPITRGPDLALSAPVRANRRRNGRDLVKAGLITTGPDFVDPLPRPPITPMGPMPTPPHFWRQKLTPPRPPLEKSKSSTPQPLRPFGGKGLDLGTRRSPFEELPIPPLTDREARWRGATSACASASLSAKLDSMPTRRTTAAC